MGMFDYVNVAMPCPECGKPITDFQSKDAGCNMDTIEPEVVGCFYSRCESCKTWIEFARSLPKVQLRAVPLTREQVEALGFQYLGGKP